MKRFWPLVYATACTLGSVAFIVGVLCLTCLTLYALGEVLNR